MTDLRAWIARLVRPVGDSAKDLAPIVAVVGFFQLAVLRQPLPNLLETLAGAALVLVGLTLFIEGLQMGLFPMGETMADAFARKGSVGWLALFAFALGFGTTIAEPALTAVAAEAATIAAEAGTIDADSTARARYAIGLRVTVAVAVGVAIVIGILRILRGWRLDRMIGLGYAGVVVMTLFAPREIVGIAYDSGGVTTSTITVPLVTALGVGLASAIKGRSPLIDGFGLIALASLTPMIFVMAYGMILR